MRLGNRWCKSPFVPNAGSLNAIISNGYIGYCERYANQMAQIS